ncbi:MAG TPA: hypothetical protein DCG51_05655 [Erysipelotrichaceae bacterium]|nr:hypothetical protein [Erysipelotrichaceae bacterium]
MDRSDVAYLVSKEWIQDEFGVQREQNTESQVFVQVNSVSMSEWFEGGRNGLNPELRFTMFRYDYNDQEEIKYNGKYYKVYRVYYAKNDTVELYCERRKGNASR